MAKGQLCDHCGKHTVQWISANRLRCTICKIIYPKEVFGF